MDSDEPPCLSNCESSLRCHEVIEDHHRENEDKDIFKEPTTSTENTPTAIHQKNLPVLSSSCRTTERKMAPRQEWEFDEYNQLVLLSQLGYPMEVMELILIEKRSKQLCSSKMQKHKQSQITAAEVLSEKLVSILHIII